LQNAHTSVVPKTNMSKDLYTNEKPNTTTGQPNQRYTSLTGLVFICFFISILAVSAVILAGLGSRWGWWHFRTGLIILKYGGYASLVGAGLSLLGCVWAGFMGARLSFVIALIGLFITVPVAGTLWQWKVKAQTVPRIHDITTDTESPPSFKAILPMRRDALNPSDYGGREIAAQQRAGYPDIGPLMLTVSPDEAFQKAVSAAVNMGWQVVDVNQAEGRIEATDTTCWFGFKDDIVVRIVPDGAGSRIDIRSVSRVGISDVGTNARRIQKFLKKVS